MQSQQEEITFVYEEAKARVSLDVILEKLIRIGVSKITVSSSSSKKTWERNSVEHGWQCIPRFPRTRYLYDLFEINVVFDLSEGDKVRETVSDATVKYVQYGSNSAAPL